MDLFREYVLQEKNKLREEREAKIKKLEDSETFNPKIKIDSIDHLKNNRPKVKILKMENVNYTLSGNESSFIPIGTLDSSINISDIEKDVLEDGFTKNLLKEQCDSINAEIETKCPISLEKIESCESSDETIFYTMESCNSKTDTDDDCVIVDIISKNEENNLLDCKKQKFEIDSEYMETSLSDNSVEIIEPIDESVKLTQESRCSKDEEYDLILGPLKIKYHFKIDLEEKSLNFTK